MSFDSQTPESDHAKTEGVPAAVDTTRVPNVPFYRRPIVIICASTTTSACIELLGRILGQFWGVGYGVTGTLTLLALSGWAASAIYMVQWAPNVPRVTRTIITATCLLVFSQAASMVKFGLSSDVQPFTGFVEWLFWTAEEGCFLLGLVGLMIGLYLSVIETAKARANLLRESRELIKEVGERRRVAEALRESEEKYRTLVDSAPNAVMILQGGCVAFANDAAAAMFGFSHASECLGRTPSKFITQEDRERLALYEKERTLGNMVAPEKYEAVLQRRNGEAFPALVFVRDIPLNGHPAKQVVAVDLTEQKRAEDTMRQAYADVEMRVQERTASLRESNRRLEHEIAERQRAENALREREEKYRSLITSLSEVVYRVSLPDGVYEYMGPSASEVFGYTPELLMSEPLYLRHVVHSDSLHVFDEWWQGAKQGTVPELCEYRILDPQGKERWIYQSNSLVRDSVGTPLAIEGICRDITEQKRAQHIIEEHRARLFDSAKMSVLGEMTANIAHEINNPLNVVSGSAEQLQSLVGSDRLSPEIASKLTQAIVRNVFRIKRIIHGFRSFTRNSAQEPFRRAHLRTIIEDTVSLCSHRFTSHEITLHVAHVPDSLIIECRPPQIMEILTNLLSNSLHAVEDCHERWVSIEVVNHENEIEVAVIDSGPGISAEISATLFDPFVTTKASGKGMGLGLSVSKRLVESHHGSLKVDAASAHTRFVMRLPRWQQAPEESMAKTH